jgi:hypothetical protein
MTASVASSACTTRPEKGKHVDGGMMLTNGALCCRWQLRQRCMTASVASSACTTQTEGGSVSTEQRGLRRVALHGSQRGFNCLQPRQKEANMLTAAGCHTW